VSNNKAGVENAECRMPNAELETRTPVLKFEIWSLRRLLALSRQGSYSRRMHRLILTTIALAAAMSLVAAETNASRYEFRAVHDRDGIGKFYMGREIAHVMGHQAADWLERPEREQEERTSLLVAALKFKPGEQVADIGAGTGYLTRRIAQLVTPGGGVFAVEIQPEMLTLLTNKARAAGITNVVPVLGTTTDPKLPPRSLDTIIMVDVYHEFDHPHEMVEAMCRALKPGGRMVFVEFRGEDENVPIKRVHKMTEAQVKKEMTPHPLVWKETIRTLPWQHAIVFTRREDAR
jgi:SAM-dependent methyltransferase